MIKPRQHSQFEDSSPRINDNDALDLMENTLRRVEKNHLSQGQGWQEIKRLMSYVRPVQYPALKVHVD